MILRHSISILLLQVICTRPGGSLKQDAETIIKIKGLGKIQGTIQTTYLTGRKYMSLSGIPYGKIVKRFAVR